MKPDSFVNLLDATGRPIATVFVAIVDDEVALVREVKPDGTIDGPSRELPLPVPHAEVLDAADGWFLQGIRLIQSPTGTMATDFHHRMHCGTRDALADYAIVTGRRVAKPRKRGGK